MPLAGTDAHQVYLFSYFGYGFNIFRRNSMQSVCFPLSMLHYHISGTLLAVPLVTSGTPTAPVTTIGDLSFPEVNSSDKQGNICLIVPPGAATVSNIVVLAKAIIHTREADIDRDIASINVTYASCSPNSGCSAFSTTPWATEHVGDAAQL